MEDPDVPSESLQTACRLSCPPSRRVFLVRQKRAQNLVPSVDVPKCLPQIFPGKRNFNSFPLKLQQLAFRMPRRSRRNSFTNWSVTVQYLRLDSLAYPQLVFELVNGGLQAPDRLDESTVYA